MGLGLALICLAGIMPTQPSFKESKLINVVGSPAGALAIPLDYEIHIEFPESHRTEKDGKEMLAAAWAQFWEKFVDSVCSPLGPEYDDPNRFLQYETPTKEDDGHAYYLSRLDNRLTYALPLHPRYLRIKEFEHDAALHSYARNAWQYRDGARPSTAFGRRVTAEPKIFRGEWFAAGVGYAWNGEGELERGIVLTVELANFIAAEGSLSARGVVIATFLGTSLLAPMFATTLGTSLVNDLDKLRGKFVISKRLANQTVQCDITAGFTFSRADLVAKFEHRLKLQGVAGICETQSALAALGYSPGHLDGKAGLHYHAAAKAFAAAWGLSEKDLHTPVFFNMIARALAGERPPGK